MPAISQDPLHGPHVHNATVSYFAVFQATSNGGQRVSNLRPSVNRPSDLPHNGAIWRFDRQFLKNWRPPIEVPWKPRSRMTHKSIHEGLIKQ